MPCMITDASAEKLQAIASPWADFISELDARYINCENGLTTIIDVDMRRGRDFQTLAQFVCCCWFYPERMVPTSSKMEQWLSKPEEPNGVFKTAMKEALTKFWHIGYSKQLNYPFTRIQKRVAPIEFVFIGESSYSLSSIVCVSHFPISSKGVILYILRDYSDELCAEEIYKMRTHVRKKFPDVRARSDITHHLWDFVAQVAERQDNNSPPEPQKRRAAKNKRGKYYEGSSEEDETSAQATKPSKKTKARR